MIYLSDQLNRSIFLDNPPARIVSLVPSQTELLVDLGLEDKIIGVTKFCVHPSHLRKSKSIVGGTKNYRLDVIETLKPDLIIGNKEENDRGGIEQLAERYPIWMSNIITMEDNISMIGALGEIFGKSSQADRIKKQLSDDFSMPALRKGTAVYLIWNDPVIAAGKHTFIDQMLELAGFQNLVLSERYPALSIEELGAINPDFLLLSSEPFPFKEKHRGYFQEILPKSKIKIVDGEFFSWYGTRLLHSKKYFEKLI